MRAVVVGAGFAGLVAASLLKRAGASVVVYETREHIGGNCYDETFEIDNGDRVRVHKYGAHVFHTDSECAWRFVNRHAAMKDFRVEVKANTSLGVIPVPYNDISESITGKLTDDEIRDLIFRPYTIKQWGVPWDDLPQSIRRRVQNRRHGADCRYHTDRWSGIPAAGYESLFESMADGISVRLGSDRNQWRSARADLVVYTAPLDEYFGYCNGRLGWRSLEWRSVIEDKRDIHILNECNATNRHTRSCDHSFWHSLCNTKTIVTYEYPCENDEFPLYPKQWGEDAVRACEYRRLAQAESNTIFCGRLATYNYLDMDRVVDNAHYALTHVLCDLEKVRSKVCLMV